jgi:hypothetical protein
MLRTTAFVIFAALATAIARGGDTPVLEVHDREGVRVLDAKVLAEIRSLALRLLETSNFLTLPDCGY